MPVVRVRGFEDSLERSWPAQPSATAGVTCYDDVGTSYLLNLRWLNAFSDIADPVQRLRAGLAKFATSGAAGPSRLVWFTDQSGEAVPRATDSSFAWNNAFDDNNKSVMGFVDGHAAYIKPRPGVLSDKEYSLGLGAP